MSNLSRVMYKKRITQTELAKRLNISQPAVNKQVRKGITRTTTALNYAKALDMDPRTLLEI